MLEATREPGDQALLYPEGSPGLPGNTSVPPAATQVPLGGHGALYQVDAVSFLQNTTQNLANHTGEPATVALALGSFASGWRSMWGRGLGEQGRGTTGLQMSQGHLTKPPFSSGPLAPQSLEVIGRGSPYDLSIGWAPAPGQREGYRVSWHQEGSQSPLDGLVDLGPDNSSLTLRGLVPGSCYTVSLWTWAGNLSSSIQMARACTREFLPQPLGGQPWEVGVGPSSFAHCLLCAMFFLCVCV